MDAVKITTNHQFPLRKPARDRKGLHTSLRTNYFHTTKTLSPRHLSPGEGYLCKQLILCEDVCSP